MGGQIVMECYRLFPERINGLVLADTFPTAETPEGKAARNAMADRLAERGHAGLRRRGPGQDGRPVRRRVGTGPGAPHDDFHPPRRRGGGPARPGRTPGLPGPVDDHRRPHAGRRRPRRLLHPGVGRRGDARARCPDRRWPSSSRPPTCRTWNSRLPSTTPCAHSSPGWRRRQRTGNRPPPPAVFEGGFERSAVRPTWEGCRLGHLGDRDRAGLGGDRGAARGIRGGVVSGVLGGAAARRGQCRGGVPGRRFGRGHARAAGPRLPALAAGARRGGARARVLGRWRTGMVWGVAVLAVTGWYTQPYDAAIDQARRRHPRRVRSPHLQHRVRVGHGRSDRHRQAREARPRVRRGVQLPLLRRAGRASCRRPTTRTAMSYARTVRRGPRSSAGSRSEPSSPSSRVMAMPGAVVTIGGRDVRIQLAHPSPPLPGDEGKWRQELGRVREFARIGEGTARHRRRGLQRHPGPRPVPVGARRGRPARQRPAHRAIARLLLARRPHHPAAHPDRPRPGERRLQGDAPRASSPCAAPTTARCSSGRPVRRVGGLWKSGAVRRPEGARNRAISHGRPRWRAPLPVERLTPTCGAGAGGSGS